MGNVFRAGIVTVSPEFLKDKECRVAFFKEFMPWEMRESLNAARAFDIKGESGLFEEVNEGDLIPRYNFQFERIPDGEYKVTAVKI